MYNSNTNSGCERPSNGEKCKHAARKRTDSSYSALLERDNNRQTVGRKEERNGGKSFLGPPPDKSSEGELRILPPLFLGMRKVDSKQRGIVSRAFIELRVLVVLCVNLHSCCYRLIHKSHLSRW